MLGGVGLLKVASVGTGLLLIGVICQFARQAARVRQIENHKAIDLIRELHGITPSHHPAPVVADDDDLGRLEVVDHGIHIPTSFSSR